MSESDEQPTDEQVASPVAITSMADLDAAMARVSGDSAQPEANPSATTNAAQAAPDDELLTDDETDAVPTTPAQPAQDAAPQAQQSEQPRYSRKDAARLAEQAQVAERRAAEAEQQARQALETLAARQARDQHILSQFEGRQAKPGEKDQLLSILANEDADWNDVQIARNRLTEIDRADKEIAPYVELVEGRIIQSFNNGMATLKSLPGVTQEVHDRMYKAPAGVEALRIMHDAATRATAAKYDARMAELQTQVRDLKTQLAAQKPQPIGTSGATISGSNDRLAGYRDARGLPTEEAIQAAKDGQWRATVVSR